MSSRPPAQPAQYPTTWRRYIARCRTGCLTCRQRKKKCDELKPRCTGCIKMKIECTWPKPPASIADNVLARLTSGEDKSSPIVWSELLGSFSSLPVKLSLTTPHSNLLLQHYLVELGPNMAPVPLNRNPFVSVVLPLAYSDELVMQCVFALGGAGLSFKQQNEDPVLRSSTTVHYFCVVKSLRLALQDLEDKDTGKILRILLVLILIANFEAFAGKCFHGEIFPHLRASRQLILWLMDGAHDPKTESDRSLLGFLLEAYAYLVLVNSFCAPGELDRFVPYDDFLSDLTSLAIYPTFGVMLDGCHGLMEMIPDITKLAISRLAAGQDGSAEAFALDSVVCSEEDLQTKITGWKNPGTLHSNTQKEAFNSAEVERAAISECYRHALSLYLATSASGLVAWEVDDVASVQHHVQEIANLVALGGLQESRYTAIIMWPLLIAGSCIDDESLQEILLSVLRGSAASTWNSSRASQLLEMLWEERRDDPRVFGSCGLYLTMKKKSINFCMA